MINRININRSSIISELNPIPSETENFHYKKNEFQMKVIVYMIIQFMIIDAFVIASVTSTQYSDYISKSVPLLTCFMAILSICILIQVKLQEFLIKVLAVQYILFFFYCGFMAYVISFLACVI
jgi:FtsH-binding integral membrane protein